MPDFYTMHSDEAIRASIMRRVYQFYILRQVSAPMVRAVIFLSACLAVTPLVSVPNVLANITKVTTIAGIGPFLSSAFLKTEFFVQGALLIAAFVLFWSLIDLVKGAGRIPAHA